MENVENPMPNDGVTALGEHPATPNAVTVEQVAERAAANKAAALSSLGVVLSALDSAEQSLPSSPGDNSLAQTRAQLAFCRTRLNNEIREIKGV